MEEGKAEPAEGAVLTMLKRRPGERDGKMGAEVGREGGTFVCLVSGVLS